MYTVVGMNSDTQKLLNWQLEKFKIDLFVLQMCLNTGGKYFLMFFKIDFFLYFVLKYF